MPERNLIILTTHFPTSKGEPWLANEVKFIPDKWKKVSIFCNTNLSVRSFKKNPQIELLPNIFNYKRNFTCFFNRYFLGALLGESRELLKKRKFIKNIFKSTSAQMRIFQQAQWFSSQYISPANHYLLYSYWGNENASMACFVKLLNRNVEAICRVHRFDIYEEHNTLGHIIYRKFQLKHLYAMFPVSDAGAKYLKMKYPQFSSRIRTNYLGSFKPDSVKLNPVPHPQRLELITCAVVTNRKRLDLIVEILKNMKVPVRWVLAGDGPDMALLKNLCKQLPANVSVEFCGFLDGDQIINLYETTPFHYYISTSNSEGLPVSVMESVSFGVPVISTDVGGCDEIVNSVTGILIPQDFDTVAFAKILEGLYSRYDYSEDGRKKIHIQWDTKFNAERNYKDFYKMLLEIDGLKQDN